MVKNDESRKIDKRQRVKETKTSRKCLLNHFHHGKSLSEPFYTSTAAGRNYFTTESVVRDI